MIKVNLHVSVLKLIFRAIVVLKAKNRAHCEYKKKKVQHNCSQELIMDHQHLKPVLDENGYLVKNDDDYFIFTEADRILFAQINIADQENHLDSSDRNDNEVDLENNHDDVRYEMEGLDNDEIDRNVSEEEHDDMEQSFDSSDEEYLQVMNDSGFRDETQCELKYYLLSLKIWPNVVIVLSILSSYE